MAGLWSGVAVVAAIALAGPAGTGHPVLAAVGTTTDPAASPLASADPLPPIPLPDPGRSLRERSEQAKLRLDGRAGVVPDVVTAWGMDDRTGKLKVDVVGADTTAASAFLVLAGVDPSAVIMRTGAARNRTFLDLVGGDAIYSSSSRCSLGFSAKDRGGKPFVLTAGHCTKGTTTWSGYNRTTIGTARGKNFPGDDYGSIAVTNSTWKTTPKVKGGPNVKGENVAAFGAKVCRSGSTTGYKCGIVQAFNQTVNYGGGNVVMGLTMTTACAEPGDSGGSFFTPSGQAQGLLSGGNGSCAVGGGTTYFQPIGEVLRAYGMTLVKG